MKDLFVLMGAGLLLVGCSSASVTLAPVGPNPAGGKSEASTGELQVFSRTIVQDDDQNQAGDGLPVWYQHTDYNIFDQHGKLVKHVGNTTGHYAVAPDRIVLPAGEYLVKAQAQDFSKIAVPVTIERGRTTRVHLDNNWKTPEGAPKRELVTLPDGKPVGWRAGSASEMGIN